MKKFMVVGQCRPGLVQKKLCTALGGVGGKAMIVSVVVAKDVGGIDGV
jgi:hypothetical protein